MFFLDLFCLLYLRKWYFVYSCIFLLYLFLTIKYNRCLIKKQSINLSIYSCRVTCFYPIICVHSLFGPRSHIPSWTLRYFSSHTFLLVYSFCESSDEYWANKEKYENLQCSSPVTPTHAARPNSIFIHCNWICEAPRTTWSHKPLV